MLLNIEEEKLVNSYVRFLEQHSYSEVKGLIENLFKKDKSLLMNFYIWLFEKDFFIKISDHKIKLSDILTKTSKVSALPEDRSRVVFLLAKHENSSLQEVNQAFAKEFGHYFKIYDTYAIGNRNVSWKFLAKKAREIKQGYKNCCYLSVQDTVAGMLEYYKNYQETNLANIDKMVRLGEEIMGEIGDYLLVSPQSKPETLKKIEQFYSINNRLKLDVDRLKEDYSFEKMAEFIVIMISVGKAKIYAIEKQISTSDIVSIEKYFLNYYASRQFDSLISAEGLMRLHKKLMPVGTKE